MKNRKEAKQMKYKNIEKAIAAWEALADDRRSIEKEIEDKNKIFMPGMIKNEEGRKLLKKTSEEIKKLTAKKKKNHIYICIAKNNYYAAIYADIIPGFCEIWNKYTGKKYGTKTKDKIFHDLKINTGCNIYIKTEYLQSVSVYYPDNNINNNVSFYTNTKLIDENNRVMSIDPGSIQNRWNHIENIAEKVKQIEDAEKAAADAKKILNDATSVFNAAAVDGLKTYNKSY